ncbi:hypothetical protein RvY_04326 [Ramazzottius varieornatus]|uniref:Uncharacterized protein n=1 Tax=Ramazzottius varieornatus TaxID=947166 RepID=A0A1D1UR97_RAMVA|nr:hypothetical protein RvY_04326 [Ramazzottius varieornatus]
MKDSVCAAGLWDVGPAFLYPQNVLHEDPMQFSSFLEGNRTVRAGNRKPNISRRPQEFLRVLNASSMTSFTALTTARVALDTVIAGVASIEGRAPVQ